MPKHINWRRVKKHRSYRVDEAARLLLVSKGTVRRWIKKGLPIVNMQKPFLITGDDLIDFLKAKSSKKQKYQLDECLCFTCKKPQKPAFKKVEISVSPNNTGMMRALCSKCDKSMFKRVSEAQIGQLKIFLSVAIKQADAPIKDSTEPCLNDHLRRKEEL